MSNNKEYISRLFVSTDEKIYQILRDIDFMMKIEKKTQIINLQLIKLNSNKQFDYIKLGDFNFQITENNFDEIDNNQVYINCSKIINNKCYDMNIRLISYPLNCENENSLSMNTNITDVTDITNTKKEFYIVHPNFEIK